MISVADIFETMNNKVTPEMAEKINTTYLFEVGDEGKWLADLTKTEGPWISKAEGETEAKCVVTVPSTEDWVALTSGEMNPTAAFMQGKLKVKGDMSLAMKLQGLLG